MEKNKHRGKNPNIIIGLFMTISLFWVSMSEAQNFPELARLCASSVDAKTITALVSVESSFNPYAIGVVDGVLTRQPRNLDEALETVAKLESLGMNYSVGLAQVNKYNLKKYGLTHETAFDPCKNLIAGSAILTDCYERARKAGRDEQAGVRAALSCYYSGNFTTGFREGYVQKVAAHAGKQEIKSVPKIEVKKTSPTKKKKRTQIVSAKKIKTENGDRDPAFVF